MQAPEFWCHGGPAAGFLAPFGAAWAGVAALRRSLARPWRAPVPVICVGNLVAGGSGKTPLAIAVALSLRAKGRTPHILSRGYGGQARGPLRVTPDNQDAALVGDEPLLLARHAPTWIGADRARGARAACDAGCDVIVMDDGMQNFTLAKDFTVIAIDGGFGFGNGRVMPAGPLRETLAAGLARTQAAVVIGDDVCGAGAALAGRVPVLGARLVPAPGAERLADKTVFAFAGIGRPQKFFDTLAAMRCRLAETRSFADHHVYRPDEIMAICERAAALGAVPVTTEKDAVRLPAEARTMVEPLAVTLEWSDEAALDDLLDSAMTGKTPHRG